MKNSVMCLCEMHTDVSEKYRLCNGVLCDCDKDSFPFVLQNFHSKFRIFSHNNVLTGNTGAIIYQTTGLKISDNNRSSLI